MFIKPIRPARFETMEELLEFSYQTELRDIPMSKCEKNGQIAFSDAIGRVFVTPYRPEIHSLLEKNGFINRTVVVPFSNGDEISKAYTRLKKAADTENWNDTYEKAFKYATKKGIKPVKPRGIEQVQKILEPFIDTNTNIMYECMAKQFLLDNSEENIGTYVIVDKKTILVCDEYGQTFLIKSMIHINYLVDWLFEAHYTQNPHQTRFVHYIDA